MNNTMKSGTRDEAEGMWHEVKGKIKKITGKVGDNSKMATEGADEEIAGKIQKKIGEIKKVVGS